MKIEASPDKLCPVVMSAFELLGRKWTGLIIKILMQGNRHFTELVNEIPDLSPRMLTVRIKELEKAGLVTRSVDAGMPVRVRYGLTEKGRDLTPALTGIEVWARAWAEPESDSTTTP